MLKTRQNYHWSKLPKVGEIGRIFIRHPRFSRPEYYGGRHNRCIVESYSVTDSADYRYSKGIHLVTVRMLATGERKTFSGFYFRDEYCDEQPSSYRTGHTDKECPNLAAYMSRQQGNIA